MQALVLELRVVRLARPMKHTKCCATQVIYTVARQQPKTLAHHPIVDTFGPMKHTKSW